MKEDLISGLKNAIERGFSLESAVKSFLNAGYNAQEVRDAAEHLSHGASSLVYSEINREHATPEQTNPVSSDNTPIAPPLEVKKKSKHILIIILSIILAILGAGILSILFFKDEIISFFSEVI